MEQNQGASTQAGGIAATAGGLACSSVLVDSVDVVAQLLDGGPMGALSDDDLLALVSGLEGVSRVVYGLQVRAAHEVEARCRGASADESLARRRGFRSAVSLLQQVTLASARTVKARIRLGSLTTPGLSLTGGVVPPRLEHLAQALHGGAVAAESAQLIAQALTGSRGAGAEDLDYAQRCLVESATGLDYGSGGDTGGDTGVGVGGGVGPVATHADGMRVMCRTWSQFLDQDGAEPREQQVQRKRCLNLGPENGGLVAFSGLLTPEVAATLGRLFDAINSPAAAKDTAGVTGDSGTPESAGLQGSAGLPGSAGGKGSAGVRPDVEGRTPAQKRHDAFAMILRAAAKSQDVPNLGGAPVTVIVQTTAAEFHAGFGSGWVHGADGEPLPIAMSAVNHAACSGAVQYVAQDRKGRILELSSPSRVFTAHQRRAILTRDGGCVIPGCTVPASWCEIHHAVPHAAGGATHTDNGMTLCYFHHRTLDEGTWEVRMKDGVPQVRAPQWIDERREWKDARPPLKPPGLDHAQTPPGTQAA